jgi:hypothetical protein
VFRAIDDERRWHLIESALGSIEDEGHEWDEAPAACVRSQRRADQPMREPTIEHWPAGD